DPGLTSNAPQITRRNEPLPEPRADQDPPGRREGRFLDERRGNARGHGSHRREIYRLGVDDPDPPEPGVDRMYMVTDRRDDPPSSSRANPNDRYHHVERGETLSSIAQRYYGDSDYWRTIYEANPRDLIPAPERLGVGVRIVIPMRRDDGPAGAAGPGAGDADAEASTPRVDSSGPTDRSGRSGARSYTIQRGDTLSELAQRLMGSAGKWHELYDMNRDRIDDPDVLQAGVTIVVPE
ncbi:MAG: LysM peptidoglycan-binding domain-containing protein, partial [Alphaproteobacteria bacterium]|nr:LysM peptidoglycan-binding domain-containing protein [Alphaproteobacteria bacterium]